MIETLAEFFTSTLGVIFKALLIPILALLLAGLLVVAYEGVKILFRSLANYSHHLKEDAKTKVDFYIEKIADAISTRYEKVIQRNNGIDINGTDRRKAIEGLWHSTCGRYYLIISENDFFYTVTLGDEKTGKEDHGIFRNLYEAREKYLFQFDGVGLYTIGYNPKFNSLYFAHLNILFHREEPNASKGRSINPEDVSFEEPTSNERNDDAKGLKKLQQEVLDVNKLAEEVYKDIRVTVDKMYNNKGNDGNDKKNT